MKLGVITDGISRDFAYALSVMDEYDLPYAELQFLWDKEVGDLDVEERKRALELIKKHDNQVSCISRHLFAGLPMTTRAGDGTHLEHMDGLKRCIEMSHEFDCRLVRIMSGRKEMILWGSHGAERWNVAEGAWESCLALIAPAIELARAEKITLVVETGNGSMVNSCYTACKLIDDLNADDVLKVLWDPGNSCWAHETAYPDAYELIKDDYLGHIHIKDVRVDTPRSHLEVCQMGKGQLADSFEPIATALRHDGYDGVISLESVYHPGNGDFEAGFRLCVETFKRLFG